MNSIPSVEIDSSDHVAKTTKTTCPYCGVGCGVSVNVQQKPQGPVVQVEGDAEHPSNFGRLCIKGSRLADTLGLETRLLQPMFGRKPLRTVTTWDAAINKIADKFQSCIDKYGRDSIAFYVSGQLLTEDYYVVNKFVKAIWALQISIPTHAFACHLQWQVTNVVSVKILCLQVMKILNMQIWWFWLVPIPHGAILCCISGLCRLKATIRICLLW